MTVDWHKRTCVTFQPQWKRPDESWADTLRDWASFEQAQRALEGYSRTPAIRLRIVRRTVTDEVVTS